PLVVRAKSPFNLTESGLKIFRRPVIQEFVSNKLDEIINKIKTYKIGSAYQAQELLFAIVDAYKNHSDYKIQLENEAYKVSQHIDVLMKIIAIGIRDDVFKHLPVEVSQINKTDPPKDKKSS
ncbi:unnamed protein product, partial [marine sediment metagenome]